MLAEQATSTKIIKEQEIGLSQTVHFVLDSIQHPSFPFSMRGSVAFLRLCNFCLMIILSQVCPISLK